jgi:hypothetical protein
MGGVWRFKYILTLEQSLASACKRHSLQRKKGCIDSQTVWDMPPGVDGPRLNSFRSVATGTKCEVVSLI